jgi:GDP/UDP-N,N'-diacetylbacillosamine 2-epimerase (hydrolysing)
MTWNIAYVTGSRADFGRIITTLEALMEHGVAPKIIATGAHFSKEQGYTINEVKNEKFNIIAEIDTIVTGNDLFDMINSFGKTIILLNEVFRENKIDLLLTLGDRGDMLAAAICAAHLNIPVAHIGGGQRSGSIDDLIRDAITVFSELHFCATEKNKKRIARIKQNRSNIFVVGAPDIDMIKFMQFGDRAKVLSSYGLNSKKKIVLFIQHPVTDEFEKTESHIKSILNALSQFDFQTVAILPNTDAGGKKMKAIIEKHPKIKEMKIFSNIPYKNFLNLLNSVDLMIGNSSAGIIEASSFKLPVVNIGTRQKNREKSCNVLNVSYKTADIIHAIEKALSKEFIKKSQNCRNIYGEGGTGKKIAEILLKHLEGKK